MTEHLSIFDHISPYFRPSTTQPANLERKIQEVPESLAEAEFKREQEESARQAQLTYEAEEQRIRLAAKLLEHKQETKRSTLDDPEINELIKEFTLKILMKQLNQHLEAPKDVSAQYFAEIAANGRLLIEFIRSKNVLRKKEQERLNEEKVIPENYFVKSEHYAELIKDFIERVIKGKTAIADGYNPIEYPLGLISEETIKNSHEVDKFI